MLVILNVTYLAVLYSVIRGIYDKFHPIMYVNGSEGNRSLYRARLKCSIKVSE